MPIVGFRAHLPAGGPQPCGQFPNYYQPPFDTVAWDTSCRYDTTAKAWRPVQGCEYPRVITLGAQVTICAGAAAVGNPCFGIKLYKNNDDIVAGQGQCDAGKPGWAVAQVTCPVIAEPGDTFSVKVVASCWTAGQPAIPFPSPWPPGIWAAQGYGYDMCAIDPNQFHTYFWGTDLAP